jgi:hypothetical protein
LRNRILSRIFAAENRLQTFSMTEKHIQNRQFYTQFCQNESKNGFDTEGVNLFAQAWWLDAVCGQDGWQVALDMDKSGNLQGALTYSLTQRWGFSTFKMPILTAYSGLWLRPYDHLKAHQQQSFERNTLTNLIQQLPKTDYAYLLIPPSCQNWHPFHAADWQAAPLLTHFLNLNQPADQIFAHFKDNTQRKIRKATGQITISTSNDVEMLYQIYSRLLISKGQKMRYSLGFLEKLHAQIQAKQAGQLYTASDTEGGGHAALYIVWDAQTAYYWLGGATLEHRNSGALTYLIWEILKDLKSRNLQKFDFTGSTEAGLEVFFSAFGAEKQTFFKVFQYNNRILKFLKR